MYSVPVCRHGCGMLSLNKQMLDFFSDFIVKLISYYQVTFSTYSGVCIIGLTKNFSICFLGTPTPNLPRPCNVRYLVTNYLDIGCVPRRSFFEMLLYFAEDEREKEKLEEFTSSEGQVRWYLVMAPNRTTFPLLVDVVNPVCMVALR